MKIHLRIVRLFFLIIRFNVLLALETGKSDERQTVQRQAGGRRDATQKRHTTKKRRF